MGMEQDKYFNKNKISKPDKKGVQLFLEQRFDWIALISITLLIMLILVFF
jgi:hypothetical protein